MTSKTIGVFDSGIGGLSVVHAIEKALPEHRVIFTNDTKNVPYGTKKPEQLLGLVLPLLQDLENRGCDVIVVACNTVTTTLIKELRCLLNVPLIGMEPMVKTAAEATKSKVIAVCATPTTLNSQRYNELKEKYAKDIKVLEPDCSRWSYMIETKKVDRNHVSQIAQDVCRQNTDVIVLGCTHYHWIEELIKDVIQAKAKVLQPEIPVISQLERVLAQLP